MGLVNVIDVILLNYWQIIQKTLAKLNSILFPHSHNTSLSFAGKLRSDLSTEGYTTGAQITILRGNASIPPSTVVTQRSLPTCSVANYLLPPCTVNSCLCTSCAVGAPASASLCTEHVTQTSYCRRGQQ